MLRRRNPHGSSDRRAAESANRPSTGFTLVEALVALCLACLLAVIAAPSFSAAVRTARRADGIAALAALQSAEDRYRSTHTAYGTLGDVGSAAASPAGHYLLSVTAPSASGYGASARATGAQDADASCRWLRLTVSGADVVQASGPDGSVGNDVAANRQCWRS